MSNIFYKVEESIQLKQLSTFLSYTSQSNCTCSLTDNGFRIYRPPNKNPTNDGNTMWGGIKIINSTGTVTHIYDSTKDNAFGLIKGHRYRIMFHVKGQSSNAFANFSWTNQMGWSGGGLQPTPSSVSFHNISSNFNGEDDCFYDFTINDEIVKTCTTTYSYATEGNQYLSYNHFMVGFGYSDTGSLGTDLYLSNFRMYDMTSGAKFQMLKTGIASATGFIERTQNQASINKSGEILGFEIYEY